MNTKIIFSRRDALKMELVSVITPVYNGEKFLEDKYNSKIQSISFRDKKYGWKTYSLSIKFSNGNEYRKNSKEDPFLLGFLKDYYLRPSCYTCPYSKIPRSADITLGDYGV